MKNPQPKWLGLIEAYLREPTKYETIDLGKVETGNLKFYTNSHRIIIGTIALSPI